MSEEEIYNYLISFISSKIKQNKLDLRDMAGFNLGYLSTEELQKAVQGLMDLRKAEKEENKELKEENQRRMVLELNKEIVIVNDKMYSIDKDLYNDLLNEMINNYIAKSKVKEKIEEYNKMINATYGDITHQGDIRRDNCIEIRNALQELLEEGE